MELQGPCNEPRPWGWNVVNNAKWQSWKQLGDMPSIEAMRLYVRTLEEEVSSGWWTPQIAEAFEKNMGAEKTEKHANELEKKAPPALPPAKSRSVAEVVVEGSWVSPYIASERRPPPRYEQAMALVGTHLYVMGGNWGGRYLGDAWAMDLEDLAWAPVSPIPAGPNASGVAGHAAVAWNNNVLCFGGHTKGKDVTTLPVKMLDTATGEWTVLDDEIGPQDNDDNGVPGPRGGLSVNVLGSRAYVFGGEDNKRKPLNDLWVLDLSTMNWNRLQPSGVPPSPRSAHSACTYRGRFLIVFGGGSVATCYDDLVILDTQTLEWFTPEVDGHLPPARAGHAAAVLGSTLYVVGGGNNARGCADMYSLDLTNLEDRGVLRWTLVGHTPPESAIAAEGLSLITVPMAGCLVSFGGYNGKYHNAVHVYRPEGFVAIKQQAAAAQQTQQTQQAQSFPESNGTLSAPPLAQPSTTAAAQHTDGPKHSGDVDQRHSEQATNSDQLKAAKEAVALEISIMRRQLDSATTALADAERVAEEAKEALAAERQRAMSLEVEVAELKQRLVAAAELQRELDRYRQRALVEGGQGKKPGIWGFITGADAAGSAEAIS